MQQKHMTIYHQTPEQIWLQSMHKGPMTMQMLDESHKVATNRMTKEAGTKELKGGKP